MTPALIDTGPLVAILRAEDLARDACEQVMSQLRGPGYTCWPVITEAYLLRHCTGGVKRLLGLCDGASIRILPLRTTDLASVQLILERYVDQSLDLADACLMHLAERESINTSGHTRQTPLCSISDD